MKIPWALVPLMVGSGAMIVALVASRLTWTPDLVNAAFELGGAVLLWLDVARLARDRMLRGVYWPVRAFFWAWGIWNVYYYPAIGQTFSFWAGLAVVLANTAWCALAFRYRKN